jgi:hypothetical protein
MLEEFNNIKKDILEYLEIRLDQVRLHAAENLSRILSNVATIAIIGYLLFFILLFFSIAAGFFFAELFNSNLLGFLTVTGFYFILLLIFLRFRKQIVERSVIQAVVKLLFPKISEDEK